MADAEQLSILLNGTQAWNTWREANADAVVDLRNAQLSSVNLREVNLAGADLSGANLLMMDFTKAKLTGVNFRGATVNAS